VVDALGGFDPKLTYDEASREYEDASRDYWQHLSIGTVDRLGLRPGERVLDVPCGTGHSLIAAADRVGPSGRVVGLDGAEHMLGIARQKVQTRGLANVDLHVGDMTAIPAPEVPYDAVICVLGIFFVDDMPGLVRSFHELVRPGGGRVAVTVFGERFVDPLREVFVEAVGEVAPGLDVVQPWKRTADPTVLRRIFDEAGVGPVTIETEDDEFALPSADDWWRIVTGSGLRRTVTALGPELSHEVRARCDAYIEREGIDRVVTRSRYAVLVRD
jgi:ubiquinone/menaquinone biosynthesis C-methylase UbiE